MKTFYCSDYADGDSSAVNAAIAWAAENNEHALVMDRRHENPDAEDE